MGIYFVININIFWYLNEEYLGKTKEFHQIAIDPKAGDYILTIVDESGERIKLYFSILE